MKRITVAALLPLLISVMAAQNPKPQSPRLPEHDAPLQSHTPVAVRGFLSTHCYGCHNGETKQGNLDLTTLTFDLNDSKVFARWVTIHDRVHDGEMPPPDSELLKGAVKIPFLKQLSVPMEVADSVRMHREGRATWRRMNRYEYENTLRDLLDTPWLQVKDRLPEDGVAYRFNKIGDALDVSHIQMNRYLEAADYALHEAMAKQAIQPERPTKRYYAREQRTYAGPARSDGNPERSTFLLIGNTADTAAYARTAPITVGDKDPVRREQEGVGVVSSAYEPLEPKFEKFKAPVSGHYKIRLCGQSFWAGPESPESWWHPSKTDISIGRTHEPVTIYSEIYPRQLRKLDCVDFGPEPTVAKMDVYLLKDEMIRPDAVRLFRSRPPGPRNPLAQRDGQPGVAFRWLEVEGPIYNDWPGKGHRLMFGDLPLKTDARGQVEVVSNNPDVDAEHLLRGFIKRAYRRPVYEEDIPPLLALVKTARNSGMNFSEAMITAYSAVLCSPEFVTLEEKPGRLDNYALATRLSYFLGNSEPDEILRSLASRGELRKPGVLHAQTERILASAESQRFVSAFLDYWLDLRKVNNNSPDAALYPDYYLDDFLTESSIDETRDFFSELIRANLPARNLVDSNFVMVNERLASLYSLSGVTGPAIRRVALPANSPRGGLLTQASVLKVTSNGTTTSPVIRGAWITERILGRPVPPPPPAVPAVEPDIRGATTIREQLDKHRTQPTCKACHAKIDPPGFALENFDVCGGWRERYRALGKGATVPGRGKNGQPFEFHPAQPVDASGILPDGRSFHDVRTLKLLLVKDERQIARNLVRQLVIYATGAPVRFGDRPQIEAILDRAKPSGYGVRSLIHAIVASELFQSK